MFRTLNPQEDKEFREYARTHTPEPGKWDIYHPVIREVWIALGLEPASLKRENDKQNARAALSDDGAAIFAEIVEISPAIAESELKELRETLQRIKAWEAR